MRESHTAVLERHVCLEQDHLTEPFECAWAGEATFYVYPVGPGPALEVEVQSSADGRRWVPHGTTDRLAEGTSGVRIPVTHIDGWLRLALTGGDVRTEYDIYLVLKE